MYRYLIFRKDGITYHSEFEAPDDIAAEYYFLGHVGAYSASSYLLVRNIDV